MQLSGQKAGIKACSRRERLISGCGHLRGERFRESSGTVPVIYQSLEFPLLSRFVEHVGPLGAAADRLEL